MVCGRTLVCGSLVLGCLVLISGFTFYYTLSLDGCDQGAHRCDDLTTCIPRSLVCNGHKDCPTGDDEYSQLCYNANWDTRMIAKVVIPSLENRRTGFHGQHYNTCSLSSVPRECSCFNQTWLKCQGVTSVPEHLSRNVTRLILANNSIRTLSPAAFEAYKLTLIHLDHNQLTELPAGVFSKQTRLKRLFASHNNLTAVGSGLLRDASALKWLFLTHNSLRTFAVDNLLNKENLSWVDLSSNHLTLQGLTFPRVPSLKDLILSNNDIDEVGEFTFSNLGNLTNLKLSRNSIQWIHERAFRELSELKELDLSLNELRTLHEDTLLGLTCLSMLSLEGNTQARLPHGLFQAVTQLVSLDLEEIEIEDIDIEMFAPLTKLQFLHLHHYFLCTFAPPGSVCRPDTDGLSTAQNLLGWTTLRVSVWVIGAVSCLGNSLVLWERLQARDSDNRVLSLVIRHLAVADGLMGVYLLTIGSRDVQYRDHYQQEAHEWMSSWSCSLLGMLAITSAEVTVMILVFLSLERYLMIAVPLAGHQTLTMRTAYSSLSIIWVVGVLAAAVPVLHWRHPRGFYGVNGMCLPLHISDPYHMGWEYSAFIFLGINLFCLVTVTALYTGMFVSIWRTRTAAGNMGEFEFVFRFFFIILTEVLCWTPIIVVKILALSRVQIPSHLNMWLVIFVLPINSAINPLLYTLTTPKYMGKIANDSWAKAKQHFASRRQSSADTESSRVSTSRPADTHQRPSKWVTSQPV